MRIKPQTTVWDTEGREFFFVGYSRSGITMVVMDDNNRLSLEYTHCLYSEPPPKREDPPVFEQGEKIIDRNYYTFTVIGYKRNGIVVLEDRDGELLEDHPQFYRRAT